MIDTRAVGQELQEQVLAAARKGHRRVTTTMKNVTATAQMIRPQLPALPTIDLSHVKLPSPDQLARRTERQLTQLRKTAPGLVARIPNAEYLAKLTEKQIDQLRKTAPGLIAKLPNPEQFRTGASDLADQVRSVQRQVADQVRTVTTPLTEQAASAFAQATGTTVKTRTATHIGTESHTTPASTAHEEAHGASASHNGTAAPRKTRSARTSARTSPAKAAPAKAAPASPASPASSTAAGNGKPASRRTASKKTKPASK
ncbi:MAG TPA: hypothetical protein VF843_03060 [Streptosporangiaceae bacterium]